MPTYTDLRQENHLKDAVPSLWTFEIGPVTSAAGTTPVTYGNIEAAMVKPGTTDNAVVIHEAAAGVTQCEVWINNFVQTSQMTIPGVIPVPFDPLAGRGLKYKAKVYIERMGDDPTVGAADATPSPEHTIAYIPNVNDYTAAGPIKINIANLKEGAYRVVLTFNLYNSAGDGCPFHAFTELGFLEVAKVQGTV